MVRGLVGIALAVLLGSTALAETAKELYEQGTAAFALQDYARAAGLYERAFAIKPDPALLYNAAQAHRIGGNKRRALDLYTSYLRLYGQRISNRPEVERHLAELRTAIRADEVASSTPPILPKTVDTPPVPEPEPDRQPSAPEPRIVATPAVTTATVARPDRRPAWKRPWVWGVVAGGVVVVVAIGLGVGLGLSGARDPQPSVGTLEAN